MLNKVFGQRLAAFWALLFCSLLSCNSIAQQTSNNLITNNWTGVVTTQSTGGGFSGGGTPGFNSSTNTVLFGYTQSTIAETFAINQALQGSGIQIGGYNYSWQYLNDSNTGGTLSSTIKLTSATGSTLESYSYGMNTIAEGWRTMSGTQAFQQQYGLTNVGNLSISFTGKDARFWAGYYGPQVKDVNLSLNYTVDPCVANPLSSPSCPGYNIILNSQNITATSYAINQALNLVGSGVQINGLKYGYDVNVGGDWCSISFIICLGWSPSSMGVDVSVTSSTGTNLYTASHNHTEQNTTASYSYSYVFPQQRLLSTMGNFSLTPRQNGTGAVYNTWSNWQYTPDFCVGNPLYAPSCPGYAEAYLAQQCTANPLYNSSCPGYAEALFTQQCTANPLSSQACPGYASAYLTQQCSTNPLYSTTCPGYEQAYLNSECIKDSLFSPRCEGYQTAYAIKYLVTGIDSTAVNQSLSDTAATKANDPANVKVATNTANTTVNSDGTVSTTVSTTGDSNVDKTIAPKTTSTTGSQPAAPVQLTAPPAPAAVAERKQEEKKPENKPEGGQQVAGPQGGQQEQKSDQPKTNRQELAERRQEAAKAKAVEQGKNLANEMGKVADMEAQKQIQNVVIQAMGFTPGFDIYNKAMIPDTTFYKPFTVYANQKNVDNRRLGMGLYGPSDRLHNDLVESQYNKGN